MCASMDENNPKKKWILFKDTKVSDYTQKLEQLYKNTNRKTNGWISVFVRAFFRFNEKHGNESTAAVSFYTIFSIIPLLVFVISIAGQLITSSVVRASVENFLTNTLPVSMAALMQVIDPLVSANGTMDLIALLGFLWAASNMFNSILYSINRSWSSHRSRGFIKNRLLALTFVTGLAVLVVVLFIVLFFVRLIISFIPIIGNHLLTLTLPIIIQTLLIFLLYKFGPSIAVNTRATLLSAFLVTIAIEITTKCFALYLNSGLSAFTIFYGSLAALIGLLLWIFVSYWILLFGSYLSEAIFRRWKNDSPNDFFEPVDFNNLHFEF